MSVKPVSLDQIIRRGNSIPDALLQQASEQTRLLRTIQRILPQTLADSLAGCVRKRTVLILFTQSAAAASQLRFHGPAIRDNLNADSELDIESVKIRVIQGTRSETRSLSTGNATSPETIQILRGISRFIADKELREALNRLVNTLARRSL
ncbi:MAG: DciA family protein [Gammaproteobacteria bacterium]